MGGFKLTWLEAAAIARRTRLMLKLQTLDRETAVPESPAEFLEFVYCEYSDTVEAIRIIEDLRRTYTDCERGSEQALIDAVMRRDSLKQFFDLLNRDDIEKDNSNES